MGKGILIVIISLLAGCRENIENAYWQNGSLQRLVKEEPYMGDDKLIVIKYYKRDCKDTSKYFKVEKYYSSGLLESKGEVVNGLKEGYWEYWYENGNKALEENYLHGHKSGKYKSWFPDGRVLEKVVY